MDNRLDPLRQRMARRALLKSAAAAALPLSSALGAPGATALPFPAGSSSEHAHDLNNGMIRVEYGFSRNRHYAAVLHDRLSGSRFELPANSFSLTLADGTVLRPSDLRAVPELPAAAPAVIAGGMYTTQALRDGRSGATVSVREILREGTRYMRQEVTITAGDSDFPVREISLLELNRPDARVVGTVKGSPAVAGNWFFGFEHPLSTSTHEGRILRLLLRRELPIPAHHSVTVSLVFGATDKGQLRRQFQAYIENERPRRYAPFLHYNSWYDIGFGNPYTAAESVAAIEQVGEALYNQRGVPLESFLFDDGWDDTSKLWQFNANFPDGFAPLRTAAEKYRAEPGIWLSPWGGYARAADERVAAGSKAGFETQGGRFALSGPRYYGAFRDVCVDLVQRYGVNQFKFDGTGNADHVFPGSAFDSDFDAAIHLIGELRAVRPDLYVNLTTGTYPSPFWLRYADSIWRGGADHQFAGVGSHRQQWMTYRDAATFAHTVTPGPLCPINSLMLHGIIYGRYADRLTTDPGGDFTSEVRSYFASGTQLQELYVTPKSLSKDNWDDIAEAALWARKNADTLVDSHWIGGDPAKLEVYGRAAWSPRAGIISLRNPSDKPQSYELDIAFALELPEGAPMRYTFTSPFASDGHTRPLSLTGGAPVQISLAPFEVLTLQGAAA